jgi:uncharacterized protein (DUF849 family)
MSTCKSYELSGSSYLPLQEKLIINAALTGNIPLKSDAPYVPITPDEIVADARKCFAIGATFFHVHARDEDGAPTCRKEPFEEIIAGIRKHCPGAIICLTTSGRIFKTFEERSTVLNINHELKPEFASLTLGSMNFPNEASINPPCIVQKLADAMKSKGVRPELEIFDTGMVNYSLYLARKGFLKEPHHYVLFFGLLGTMPARMADICHLVQSLPQGSTWGAAGGGRFQLSVNLSAMIMGGHVRVGLEDNLYLDYEKTELATNEALVKRIVRLAGEIRRPIATAAEAREILGLNP